jgi:hypothetical protein
MTEMYEKMSEAIEKAKEELSKANYLEESGGNAGIRKMNANKADWLRWVVYLATLGFEAEQLLAEAEAEPETELNKSECELCSEESSKAIAVKDHLIEDLQTVNSQLQEQLKTAQYSLEEANLQHQAELTRAKIDAVNDFAVWAHDHCWLEGADLVCSLELIDKYLLGLIKE